MHFWTLSFCVSKLNFNFIRYQSSNLCIPVILLMHTHAQACMHTRTHTHTNNENPILNYPQTPLGCGTLKLTEVPTGIVGNFMSHSQQGFVFGQIVAYRPMVTRKTKSYQHISNSLISLTISHQPKICLEFTKTGKKKEIQIYWLPSGFISMAYHTSV